MLSNHKKISLKDQLKIGDMVVGDHVDKLRMSYNIVAGKIISMKPTNTGITYDVKGKKYQRPNADPINFSGILEDNEVEIIDQDICNRIIELYKLANDQLISGSSSFIDTVEKINQIRMEERHKLEEKYAMTK